jgi:hypothetical protein
MKKAPDYLIRYPTRAGRDALANRLSLKIDPFSQDWEWEIAEPARFEEWLAVYRSEPLSDDERFSLMEMLIQCVEDLARTCGSPDEVEKLPQWQAVAALLRTSPRLHASSIAYWSVFDHDDTEQQFRVSVPMRHVWAVVQPELS